MQNKSPKVIFACKFTYGLNNLDNKAKTIFTDYTNYLKDDISHLTDYFSDKKKEIVGMIDYYSGMKQEKEVNLVLENGQYATVKQKIKLEHDLLKATENSNLWKGIVSFNNDWINQKIKIKDLEQIFAKEVLPKFFKKCGFVDEKKMRYCFSLHGNTDNLHIHFAFVETKPNCVNRDGKIFYRRKGQLSKEERDFLKNEMILAIERKSLVTPMITELNKEIDQLKKYFNPLEKNFILKDITNIRMEQKIIELGFLITEYRHNNGKKIKYGSIRNDDLGKRIKELTKEIKHYLFYNPSSGLYKQQEVVQKNIKRLNNYYDNLNKENHIETKVKNNELVLSKEKYVNSFIMNSIVNHALYKTNRLYNIVKSKSSKNKILLNDLLQELAFENAQKYSGKDVRFIILKNNLSGKELKEKYQLNHEICLALKKVNAEMEEYAKDFHELFVTKDFKE